MAKLSFPVLVWEDHEGHFTAAAIDAPAAGFAAFGDNPKSALKELHELLLWHQREHRWIEGADFEEAEVLPIRVEIRPERHSLRYSSPSPDVVGLRIPCVRGRRQSDGARVCALPWFDLQFLLIDDKELRPTVEFCVRRSMRDTTPEELARWLPAREAWLEELTLRKIQSRKPGPTPPCTALLAVGSPILETISDTQAFGREDTVALLVKRLTEDGRPLLIVGERGEGKTTVLAQAIKKLRQNKEGTSLRHCDPKNYWMTSGGRLIAGCRYLGQWQERVEETIHALDERDGTFCIENLLELVLRGGSDPVSSVAAFLLPYLKRHEVRIIAEATPLELLTCRRLLPGFADIFSVVTLPPLSRREVVHALKLQAKAVEMEHKIESDLVVPSLVYRLFRRFASYEPMPGSPAAFYREIAQAQPRGTRIGTEHVLQAFTAKSGLPAFLLQDEEPLAHSEVLASLESEVLGQPTACAAIANRILTFKAALNDPAKPIGTLLFCGPTGVGKTHLAQTLSRYLFGHGKDTDRLIRLDMSEYAGPGAADRFLTDPDGNPSDFINRVRRQPFVILLLDEIEKASPEIFDILMSLFDEGRLTDSHGRLTIFRSAFVILTSNLGKPAGSSLGFTESPPDYDGAARAFFRPEFFNRLDAVVRFDPLDSTTIRSIAIKELTDLAKREGFAKSRIQLQWTDRLVDHIASTGFDPRYGARPLQRCIETEVVAPLARFLVCATHPSDTELHLDWDGGLRIQTSSVE